MKLGREIVERMWEIQSSRGWGEGRLVGSDWLNSHHLGRFPHPLFGLHYSKFSQQTSIVNFSPSANSRKSSSISPSALFSSPIQKVPSLAREPVAMPIITPSNLALFPKLIYPTPSPFLLIFQAFLSTKSLSYLSVELYYDTYISVLLFLITVN